MSQSEESILTASVILISEKLDRVRNYIIRTYGSDGRLQPEHQYVIRIVDSRKRELNRVLLAKTRPVDDPDRQKAEIELAVKRRDNGSLFRWQLLSHSYGRLGCSGCAFDYVRDPMFGLPIKDIRSRLCPVCGQGIQHTITADTAQEALEGVEAFRAVVSVDSAITMRREGTQGDVQAILAWDKGPAWVYCCDVCGSWGMEPCL
jgi:hypothetical protein